MATARDEDVDVVGISILLGSHLELVPSLDGLRVQGSTYRWWSPGSSRRGRRHPGGEGRARAHTPKDFELGRIMDLMLELAEVHLVVAPS